MAGFIKSDILRFFDHLNSKLLAEQIKGELYLVGGAVMCLVYEARLSTNDIDAFFRPSTKMRELAAQVGVELGLSESWLNDAVKGFLSTKGSYQEYLVLSNLTVYCAHPEYLLAMKCLAMRIGEEFQDVKDIQYLLRHLNITDYKQAVSIISRYYPAEKFPQKTLYALEEILSG